MIDNKYLSRMLETAVVAARLAGRYAMEQINSVKSSAKSDTEIVTEADGHCQRLIVDTIMRSFPGHGIVAEEGENNKLFKQSPRGDEDIWWVIDPIDGTNNYSQRILSFAVSIGVISEGKPVLGVIFDPATDSMFAAAEGTPPQYNGRKISANEGDLEVFQTIGVESLYIDGVPKWIASLMGTLRCRSLGTTAMHLAYVAKGSFVAAIMDKPKLWDIAAGAFLAESADAIVSDWKGDSLWPIDMNNYTGQTIRTLAANKKVHKKLVDIINRG